MRTDHVKWELFPPEGDVCDLTAGDRGVKMSTDQAGLHWPDIKQVWSDNGIDRLGVEVGRLEPTLKLQVGVGMTGMEYYRCLNEWQRANSPHRLGTLRCTRPDGTSREQKFYLRDSPDTTWGYDPGAGIEDNPDEVWPLVSPESWWDSSEVTQWKVYGEGVPMNARLRKEFYGDEGKGWPLYVTDGALYVRNLGDAPLWVSWLFVGTRESFRVGLVEPSLSDEKRQGYVKGMFSVNLHDVNESTSIHIQDGYRLNLDTDPMKPEAGLRDNQGNNPYYAWSWIDAASFVPVMPGERKRVHVDDNPFADEEDDDGVVDLDVYLIIRPRYALPF